jgi:hypothetical protein
VELSGALVCTDGAARHIAETAALLQETAGRSRAAPEHLNGEGRLQQKSSRRSLISFTHCGLRVRSCPLNHAPGVLECSPDRFARGPDRSRRADASAAALPEQHWLLSHTGGVLARARFCCRPAERGLAV